MLVNQPITLQEPHRELLLQADAGFNRIHCDYPPAAELVREGYCVWAKGNPKSWLIELTPKGAGAVAMLKRPEAVTDFRLEEIDEVVSRVVNDGVVLGFAVRHPKGAWLAYTDQGSRFDSMEYSSPEAVLLSFKMFEAKLDCAFSELEYQELRPGF